MKRTAALICALAVIIGIAGINVSFTDVNAYSSSDLEKAVKNAVLWKEDNDPLSSSSGSKAADYYAIALSRAGATFDSESYLKALNGIAADYDEYSSALDMQRTLLAVTAMKGNAQYIGERDLVADSTFFRAASAPLDQQGIMGYIGALTALDAGNYEVPDWARADREDMITSILAAQAQNGSFNDDVYITACAIIALSDYNNSQTYNITKAYNGESASVSCGAAIYNAVAYLSSVQNDSADFGNLTDTAFVSMAIDSIGVSQDDDRLKKNGITVMDAVLSFQNSDGGFAEKSGKSSNSLAASYALCAMVSSLRVSEGKSVFFDFTSSDGIGISGDLKTGAATSSSASSSASSASSSASSSSSSSCASSSKATATPKSTSKPTSTARAK
ncbi:MAG: hypothetical protein LUD03_05780, partial [Firmicutes bacterium]|nr:hypothetical protein [Bacillota bacterium]